jgi:hypothetical protein
VKARVNILMLIHDNERIYFRDKSSDSRDAKDAEGFTL